MKGVGLGRDNQMANFWADLTKMAVKNQHLNVVGDRSTDETIVGTTRNPNSARERSSHSRGHGQVAAILQGVTEERKHVDSPHQNRILNFQHNQASTQVT